jgi:hypothetical protein
MALTMISATLRTPLIGCLSTLWQLGPGKVAYVSWYRFSLRTGLRRWCLRQGEAYDSAPMFREFDCKRDFPAEWSPALIKEADRIVSGEIPFFRYHWHRVGNPPDWFFNPFDRMHFDPSPRPWTEIREFEAGGDIKIAWEPSRFAWAPVLARAYVVSGNRTYLDTLNQWIKDWIEKNPFNNGLNWKCGQEASFRLFHVLAASYLLGQHLNPSDNLVHFVAEHTVRIDSNIRYALAQDTNHGTSEAAALWLAGAWLLSFPGSRPSDVRRAKRWERKGRANLGAQLRRLVQDDGSFCQHSATYHRLLLDTLNMVLFWRRLLGLPEFSPGFMSRAESALRWLISMVDRESGDAPNLGSNDGSALLPLHSREYRDFRPTIQLAAVLIKNMPVYDDGPWNEPLFWLGLLDESAERMPAEPSSKRFTDGGFITFRSDRSWALLRYPEFRFRPAHCDVMHFDLWHVGRNILRDSGTFSYNCEELPGPSYFSSVQAHNTVEFDGQEQMPRISRFLYGRWIRPSFVSELIGGEGEVSWHGSYRDAWGHAHARSVSVFRDRWLVADDIREFGEQATLRWRLIPADWRVQGNRVSSEVAEITISANVKIEVALEEGWESRYYFEKARIPVIRILIPPDQARVITEIKLR